MHELPTQIVAIPTVVQQQIVREQQVRLEREDAKGRKVVTVSLTAILGRREITDQAGRDAALVDLKRAIDESLHDADVVTLV